MGYWGFAIVCLIIALVAQAYVKSTFNKYSKVETERGITSNEFVDYIFREN